MKKSKDLKVQEAREIYKKYSEKFKEYGINSFEEMKFSTLPEYLAERYPKKYGLDNNNYNNYQKDENLNEVYVFSGEKEAYFFGTDKAVIQGHIANEDLKEGKITFSEELRKKIIDPMYANEPEKAKEFEKEFFHGQAKDLDVLEKIVEKPENLKKMIEKECEIINRRNGISKEESKKLQETGSLLEEKKEVQVSGKENEGKSNNTQIPPDVAKACKRLGITQIKAFMYAKGEEFVSKTDIPYVNKNAGNVLIIRAKDSGKSTDKYYVFQNGKLCVPGNRDEEIDKVARRSTQNSKNGTLIKPLEIDDEEQYVEYSDSQGLVIREKLEENMNLSTEDLEEYQKRIKEELEKYSEELYKIDETPFLNDAQKDELYIQANERFNRNNEDMAKKFNIDLSDVEAINLATDEKTQKQVEKDDDDYIPGHDPRYPGM